MFKTHLPISRALIISSTLIIAVGVLFVATFIVLVPSLMQIYFPKQNANKAQFIDTNAVNAAIELLHK